MDMLIGGHWQGAASGRTEEVTSPFDGAAAPYGLGAGIFTSDVSAAVRAMREIDAGTVHINWTPLWRADLMPYGGLKASGVGKEGPRPAVAEMTDIKTGIWPGRPW